MLSLNHVERLVRRIAELVGHPALEAQAAKLAQDYSEMARAASHRLEQCALMIEAGDDLQALQLAETPPPLLDLVTVLSFRQAAEWRAYCQAHNLPWVEPFYDKHVRALNATYGKGVTSDHPFFRDYRRAVLKNEHERALSILRVVVRLNPTDQNTAAELQRLQEKVLRAKLEGLQQALAGGDTAAALAELSQLEAATLPIPPGHPVWQQAQLLRCEELLSQARAFRERGDWRETERLVEEIQVLANHHEVSLPPDDNATWQALEAWSGAEHSAAVEGQDFQRAFDALEHQLQTVEARVSRKLKQSAQQWQGDFDSLVHKWREAERFGRSLDSGLLARCEQACEHLQEQIRAGQTRKRVMALAGLLLALLAVAAAGFWTWDRWLERQFLAQATKLEQGRSVGQMEELLGRLPERLRGRPRVVGPFAQARQFVARETALKQIFDQKLAALQQLAARGFTNALTQFEPLRAECVEALAPLAPQFQSTGRSKLDVLGEQWQRHLTGLQPERNANFSARLTEAEQIAAARLTGSNGVAGVGAALRELQGVATELVRLRLEPVSLDAALVRRFDQLTNQMARWAEAAGQWELFRSQAPASLEEHLKRLKQLARSPFASSAEELGMAELLSRNPSQEALLGGLLMPDQPEAWASLTSAPTASTSGSFKPAQPSNAEKQAYLNLRDDPNIQDIHAYQLTPHPHPDNLCRPHAIFTRGKLAPDRLGRQAGLLYDPQISPGSLRFEQHFIDIWDYRQVEEISNLREVDAFQRLGLRDFVDSEKGEYRTSFLKLLEQLSRDSSSPIFRAFLALRFAELAALRPTEWGLQWSPTAVLQLNALRQSGGALVQSGDWMVPNQVALYDKPLRKQFEAMRAFSFEGEARFFSRLVGQACEAGFSFAGYIDAQGVPQLNPSAVSHRELWGWSSRTSQPTLVMQKPANAQGWQKVEEPLVFSPLFAFLGDRRKILDQAAQATLYSLRGTNIALPPLFSGL